MNFSAYLASSSDSEEEEGEELGGGGAMEDKKLRYKVCQTYCMLPCCMLPCCMPLHVAHVCVTSTCRLCYKMRKLLVLPMKTWRSPGNQVCVYGGGNPLPYLSLPPLPPSLPPSLPSLPPSPPSLPPLPLPSPGLKESMEKIVKKKKTGVSVLGLCGHIC